MAIVVAAKLKKIGCVLLVTLFIILGACATNNSSGDAETANATDSVSTTTTQEMGLHPADPWEGYNRRMFIFNDWFYTNLLIPIVRGYVAVTPKEMRTGIGNFFYNLEEPFNLVNNLLQGDIEGAGTSFMRFTTNSVFGLLGVMDVATEVGMRRDSEDFGQTLGTWGVGQGNYLILPFLSPTTTRDVFSYADMVYYDPYWPTVNNEQRYVSMALKLINNQVNLLDLEDQIIGDRYSFIRDAYFQRRQFLVGDGYLAVDTFSDEDFAEDDFDNLDDEF